MTTSQLYGDLFPTTLMSIDSWNDALRNYLNMTFIYLTTYLSVSSIFELTNPKCGSPGRWELIQKEISYGIPAILAIVAYATGWVALVEPHTPFYGYYATHDHTWIHFVLELVAFMILYDAFFYWSHRILHWKWLYTHVHYHHHSLFQTSAFAQDAVHVFEAIFQGPFLFFLVSAIVPIHPISHAVFGFLTSIFALAAHDARAFDVNQHRMHHHYSSVNFGLYFPVWDYLCGTRYHPSKFQKANTAEFTNPPILNE